ncbi:MAG: tripartite tricarboxylate transporter TctB family protein [Hyphomicrobiaceae bacterium]
MRIRFGQDMATGLLFMVIGAGALYIGKDYPMGTANRPGTGVLPYILSWCLLGTGGLLAVKAFTSGDSAITGINWRPLCLVTLALVVFGFGIDKLGLFITMGMSTALCAAAMTETKWNEYLIFLGILAFASWTTFVCLLGMPVNACPSFAPCELCWLVKAPIRILYDAFNWVVR